jgi:hypothetical protein
MELHYYTHGAIDKIKWDAQLENCTNSLIYAQSKYLDTMCASWDAIATKDYSYIMPIPVKIKMGIRYSPVVPFVQQLGIFSALEITPAIQTAFVQLLQKKIKLANYNFNYSNDSLSIPEKINYVLPLHAPYTTLFDNFKKDLKKDIKKIPEAITDIVSDYNIVACVDFFKQQIGARIPHVRQEDYEHLLDLCKQYKKNGQLITKAVLSQDGLLATAIFFTFQNRIYNIKN